MSSPPNALLSRVHQAALADGYTDVEWDTMLELLVKDQLKFDLCKCGPGSLARAKGLIEILEKIEANDRPWFYEPGQSLRFVACDMLESAELAQHGGSAPGWLTAQGRQFLEALKQLVDIGARAELEEACPAHSPPAPSFKM